MGIRNNLPPNKSLVLIDGHAILHRAYHAFPKTLTTRKGELVNAVYGFTRILLKAINDLRPTYLAVAFDLPKPTFRHKEFIGYQIQRPQMDEEMKDQIQRVHEVLTSLNIPIFTLEGYEADDIIGTLATQAAQKKLAVMIMTGDKDIMQLVDKQIKVYSPVRGFTEAKIFDSKEVQELLGIGPNQIVDYKALAGDPSDNYPGVPGIGPKTAVELLSRFHDLDTIYKSLDKIPEKVKVKLTDGQESADLSQKLARIVTNAPVKLNLKACRVHDYDESKVIELFKELEFKSLIDKLPGVKSKVKADLEEKKESDQLKLI